MTHIQWTDETWNPIAGCSIVSKGCTNCYAMKMAARLDAMGVEHYAGLTEPRKAGAVWTGKMAMAPDSTLTKPLRWKKPRMIFVNSMSDLFHESVPDAWIDRVFAVMALTPQHTYQVLTKRPERMRAYMDRQSTTFDRAFYSMCTDALFEKVPCRKDTCAKYGLPWKMPKSRDCWWPLRNVWLGVSIEDQATADQRIPILMDTRAAIRWISAEPLLGPVDLTPWLSAEWCDCDREPGTGLCKGCPDNKSVSKVEEGPVDAHGVPEWMTHNKVTLDWVVTGGESGPGARPTHPHWPGQLRDQCAEADVPFFFKQWGEWAPEIPKLTPSHISRRTPIARHWEGSTPVWSFNIGKRAAGDLLDGTQHHNWPEVAA